MINDVIDYMVRNNIVWRMVGVRRPLTDSMVKDLDLMLDAALHSGKFHEKALFQILDNRLELYRSEYWDVSKYANNRKSYK